MTLSSRSGWSGMGMGARVLLAAWLLGCLISLDATCALAEDPVTLRGWVFRDDEILAFEEEAGEFYVLVGQDVSAFEGKRVELTGRVRLVAEELCLEVTAVQAAQQGNDELERTLGVGGERTRPELPFGLGMDGRGYQG